MRDTPQARITSRDALGWAQHRTGRVIALRPCQRCGEDFAPEGDMVVCWPCIFGHRAPRQNNAPQEEPQHE